MPLSRKEFLKILGLSTLTAPAIELYGHSAKRMREARSSATRLKIREVEIFYFDIPLLQPFSIAIGSAAAANDILVRVITDGGITGIGEACPFTPITGETQESNIAVARAIKDIIVGKDPLALGRLAEDFKPFVHSSPSIVAAFDMALYDILGKLAGLPLFRLLGGDKATLETDITVSLDTPEKMAKMARRRIDKGYRIIKVKVGQAPDLDLSRLAAVQEVIGNERPMRIDANQGWTVPQAISALKKMEKYNIEFCEQPVAAWDLQGMRFVRNESIIPIMADEALFSIHNALDLVNAESCDYLNIKLMKSGGISEALKIAHIAEAAGLRCMVGCMMETRIALTAAAHLAASQDIIAFADIDGNSEHTVDPVIGGIIDESGIISLPEAPGLGVDIDPAFLKRMKKC